MTTKDGEIFLLVINMDSYPNVGINDFLIVAHWFDKESFVWVLEGAVFINKLASLDGGICSIKNLGIQKIKAIKVSLQKDMGVFAIGQYAP